jgi:hypothetical protein
MGLLWTYAEGFLLIYLPQNTWLNMAELGYKPTA